MNLNIEWKGRHVKMVNGKENGQFTSWRLLGLIWTLDGKDVELISIDLQALSVAIVWPLHPPSCVH